MHADAGRPPITDDGSRERDRDRVLGGMKNRVRWDDVILRGDRRYRAYKGGVLHVVEETVGPDIRR